MLSKVLVIISEGDRGHELQALRKVKSDTMSKNNWYEAENVCFGVFGVWRRLIGHPWYISMKWATNEADHPQQHPAVLLAFMSEAALTEYVNQLTVSKTVSQLW